MYKVLLQLGGNQFRERQADAHDKAPVFTALELPSSS